MDGQSQFDLFGGAHLAAIATTLMLCLVIARGTAVLNADRLARLLAFSLLVLVVAKPILYIGVYGEPWTTSLPLALCRINEFLCVYMLLARSYRVFEIAYFLAIGSVTALLTPDLPVGFPDPRFVLFFVSHGLAVLAVLHGIFGFGFRPTLRSVRKVLVFLGIYTCIIAGLNLLLDANYLFLRQKPEGASVLDFLGPWPIYVVALIALAVGLCYLWYLPFATFRSKAPEER